MSVFGAHEPTRYTFGPLERRGVFGSLRRGQTALLAIAVVAAVGVLQRGHGAVDVLIAFALIGVAALASFYPIHGRSTEEWLPVVVAFAARGLLRRRGFRTSAPEAGVVVGSNGEPPQRAEAIPAEVGDVQLLTAPLDTGPGEIGVVFDRRAQTYTATLAVRVRAFALLSDREQEQRLAVWGTVLAELARDDSPLGRVAWVERSVPNDGDEITGYLQEARDKALPLGSSPVRSYIELVEHAADVTQDHEILLSLQLDARRAHRQIKRLGRGQEGALRLMVRELDVFVRRLEGASISVHGALPPRLYARALRDGFDPFGRRSRVRGGHGGGRVPGWHPAGAWPVATEARWDHYRADGADHVTFWVSEWPKIDVGATFLHPLLMRTNVVRSVAVVMEAIPPSKAITDVEAARTADTADETTRARMGQLTTARQRQKVDATARREEELAAGHAEVRYAGYVSVSVTAGDEAERDRACAEVEHAAHQSRLRLERLYGQQDSSFTFSLPLCRGLA